MKPWWILLLALALVACSSSTATLQEGLFVSADAQHITSGKAQVRSGVLYLVDFSTTNGPNLEVWLTKPGQVDTQDYIDLGALKSATGNQQYTLAAADTQTYSQVVIWCKRFGVLFGSAQLRTSF
jgi:hypothetical protein